jgi:outer membrane protein assembly factor BamB
LIVAAGDALLALDVRTGIVTWRQPTGALTAPPLVQEGWIVTGTESDVVARRASDGTIVWQQQHGPLHLRPTIEGDALYLPLADARVRAVDLTNGALKWERRLGGAPSEVAALAARVYVGSEDKFFYCLNPRDGRTEWRHRIGAAVAGRPAFDDDRVYFAAMDNLLRAVDRVDGALRWQAALPFRPFGGPILFGTAVVVPGAVAELPTFDVVTGTAGRPIPLAASLGVPIALRMSDKGPIAATVTGTLNAEWKLSVLEASMTIPVAPLSALPGTAVPLPPPPPPGGAP